MLIEGAEPEEARGNMVSGNFFSVAGVTTSAGRTFLPEEATASAQPVAIVSDDFRQQNYAGDHSAIGSTLM